jgi:hypothetical protein
MKIISEGWIAAIASITIFLLGWGIVPLTGVSPSDIGAVVIGILWGSIVSILAWGFRYKIKFRGRIEKWLRFFDPLKGEPNYINDGIRYYRSRDRLPSMNALLSIKELKSLEILAITHYLLVLNYIDSIKNALERGVKITIYILDPNDIESITTQTRNYGEKNIKTQIETSLAQLNSINNDNLTIKRYRKVIGEGIMLAQVDDSLSWIKIETYAIQREANSRANAACYKKDNEDFFNNVIRRLNEIKNLRLN